MVAKLADKDNVIEETMCLSLKVSVPTHLYPTGLCFGRWKIVSDIQRRNKHRKHSVLCRCECGIEKEVALESLLRGVSKSCGCLKVDNLKKSLLLKGRNYKHGLSGTPEYAAYLGMIRRCYNKTSPEYKHYGGRGIQVAPEWLVPTEGLKKFIQYMGKRPSVNHSLDRVNNDGNYESGNVRWVERDVQLKNRRKIKMLCDFTDEELLQEVAQRHLLCESAIPRVFSASPIGGAFATRGVTGQTWLHAESSGDAR